MAVGPALLTSLCNRALPASEDVLTACFLGVISRVTQLAPKQGEERGRRREIKSRGGKEKRKEVGSVGGRDG